MLSKRIIPCLLIKDGGLELMGDLSLDEQNYKMATLNEIREIE